MHRGSARSHARLTLVAVLCLFGSGSACNPGESGSAGRGGSGGTMASGGSGGGGRGGNSGSGGSNVSGGASGNTSSGGAGGNSPAGGHSGGASGGAGGSAGGAGGSGGTGAGGSTGSGGTSAADAGGSPDVTPQADTGGGADTGGADFPPLAPCPMPSVDHLESWRAHGGTLRPPAGSSLLVKEGDRHIAKVDFIAGGEWHEVVVPLVNSLAKKVDLTSSKGFTITYSATADLWVQLRPISMAHGGAQWTAKLPTTGGAVKDLFVPFAPASWGSLLGNPPFPFSQALRDANFFDFVGPPGTANSIVVRGLRIDGHVPPCS